MLEYFYSLEMAVLDVLDLCDDEPYCSTCEAIKQNLYDLSREENR